jgi:preprotein translocase subunit SecY
MRAIATVLRDKEIRHRLLITLGMLFCYRVGFMVPLPGVNINEFLRLQDSDAGGLFGLMSMLTGAALQQATLFSLGVMPYISASIIFSLLTKMVPTLEKLAKEGAAGQRKINQYTRLATIPICLLQSFFVIFGVLRSERGAQLLYPGVNDYFYLYVIVVMIALLAGTLFIMWLGEQIQEHGIGNGISLIIMAGIVAELPTALRSVMVSGAQAGSGTQAYQTLLMFIGAWLFVVVAVVVMTKAQRRIPIQQAKQTRGRRVYGGQRHFLPIKLNFAGVMPIVFASALLVIPALLGGMVGWNWLKDSFESGRGFWYLLCYIGLIFFFSFFWASLMLQPAEVANNLKEHGAFIPGIRPGKNTAEFLEGTMVRITLAGAAFLAFLAVLPNLVHGQFKGLHQTLLYFMSGTSILIVVGVALDTVEKINAMLIMRNYDGFMKESGTTGGWGRQAR